MNPFTPGHPLHLPARRLTLMLGALLFFLIVSVLVLSAVPPVSRDALTHHLALPKLYLAHGGIYRIPEIPFSYYPMNLELLYLLPLYFGNDVAPKYIHFLFALLTAALIFRYLKKRLTVAYALLGSLFFLSLPVIIRLSITVYVDLGLVFFSTAALFYLLQWMEDGFPVRKLLLSALFCGLALGTKYNALVVLAILCLFVPFIHSRRQGGGLSGSGKSIAFGMLYLAVALIVFSPWMIRNYKWTRNPIYPLYHSWFKSPENILKTMGIQPGKAVGKPARRVAGSSHPVNHFLYRQLAYRESWPEIVLVPVRIFFQGKDDDPRYFDGRLNPLLFFLPLLAFFGRGIDSAGVKTEKRVLAWFAVIFLAIAFLRVEMRIRYIAPILPPLVILSVFGVDRIRRWLDRQSTTLSVGVVVMIAGAFMGLNAMYVVGQFRQVDPIPYISGRISRDRYIENYRGEYPAVRFANQNLPGNAVILRFFLGNRIYYFDRRTLPGTGIFLRAVRQSNTPGQILSGLRERGVTHLMIRSDLFGEWVHNNFDDAEKNGIARFFQHHLQRQFDKNGYGLYQLK